MEVARVYDAPARSDRRWRVLADRLWPRGMPSERLEYDDWAKDLAPSPALRAWYGHDPDRFAEFSRRYRAELRAPAARDALARVATAGRGRGVLLLTATRDLATAHTAVLADVVRRSIAARR